MADTHTTHEGKSAPHPAAASRSRLVSAAGGIACGSVLIAVFAILAVADGQMFEDAEFSQLYRFTLDQAYSRFEASDRQVPAVAQADPLDAMLGGAAGPAGQPALAPGGAAQRLQNARKFGYGNPLGQAQQKIAQARAAAGAAAPPGAHTHDDGGPYTLKGNEHLRKREYAQAVQAYELALKENPNRLVTRHSLGDALRFLGRFDEAIAAYREVLRQNPSYYCCYTHVGDVEKQRSNNQAAEKAYASAIAGYKEQLAQGGGIASVARFHLAKLYSDLDRNLTEAIALAEQANSETPNQIPHEQLLAQLYEKAGRTQDAIRMYGKLAEISPQHAAYFRQQQQRLSQAQPATPPPTP